MVFMGESFAIGLICGFDFSVVGLVFTGFTGKPEFQTSFFAALTQVYLMLATIEVAPNLEQFAPALTAPNADEENSDPKMVREIRNARFFFMSNRVLI